MGTNLQTLRGLVQIAIGNRDSADDIAIMEAAINWAAALAVLTFEPPELKATEDLVVTSGSSEVSLTSLTRLLDVASVYNYTDGIPMWFIPFEQWNVIVPASVGSVKYFSEFGNTLFVKDAPSGDKTLKVSTLRYPTELVGDGDTLDFVEHDSYVVGVAAAVCWSAYEEAESAALWQQVVNNLSMPLLLGTKARQYLAGKKKLLESVIGAQDGDTSK